MKKTLALILTVIMVLSIMPMAYAQRVTYSPEIEEYIEDYIRAYTYYSNIYETSAQKEEVQNTISEAIYEVNENLIPTYKNLVNIEADDRLEELTAFHKNLKKSIDEVEKRIAANEIVIVVDIYEYSKYALDFVAYYSDKDLNEIGERTEKFGSDKFIFAKTEFDIGCDMLSRMGGEFVHIHTQAELDVAMAMVKPFYDLMRACLDGNHPYGEYISDNNATEDADGTNTATCEFCGATDTITDEGTKLEKEEKPNEEPTEEKVSFFEMIFNLIKEFFEKIFSIFK